MPDSKRLGAYQDIEFLPVSRITIFPASSDQTARRVSESLADGLGQPCRNSRPSATFTNTITQWLEDISLVSPLLLELLTYVYHAGDQLPHQHYQLRPQVQGRSCEAR
jgi:hypothetical protein